MSPGHRKTATHPTINTQNPHGHTAHTFNKATHSTANLISCMGVATHPQHNHTYSTSSPSSSRPSFQQISTDTFSHLTYCHAQGSRGMGQRTHDMGTCPSCHLLARVHDHWPTMPLSTGSIITRLHVDRTTHRHAHELKVVHTRGGGRKRIRHLTTSKMSTEAHMIRPHTVETAQLHARAIYLLVCTITGRLSHANRKQHNPIERLAASRGHAHKLKVVH